MNRVKQGMLFGFAIAILLFLAYVARHALLLIYVSCIFAVVLSPAVDWICKLRVRDWHPSRGFAVVLIAIASLAIGVLISFLAFPAVAAQLNDFVTQLPDLLNSLRKAFGKDRGLINLNSQSISGYVTAHMSTVTKFFGSVASTITSTATVFLLTAYLTLEGETVLRWSMSLFEPEAAGRLERTLRRAGIRMRKWLTGQLMLMLILGSASAVTFGIMQIRFFYLLALFAGIANFIPFLGPLLTVALAGSVAAVDSLWKALGVLIFYVVYQQIESAFLTPKIMHSQVKISPVAVIISLLIGSEIAGVVGAMVAVSSAVLASSFISEYLSRDTSKQ